MQGRDFVEIAKHCVGLRPSFSQTGVILGTTQDLVGDWVVGFLVGTLVGFDTNECGC